MSVKTVPLIAGYAPIMGHLLTAYVNCQRILNDDDITYNQRNAARESIEFIEAEFLKLGQIADTLADHIDGLMEHAKIPGIVSAFLDALPVKADR